MKRPPGLVGSFGLLTHHGKLHLANPERLDWHHGTVTTYCGRNWPIPQHTRTWDDADEADVCKTCMRAAQLSESVAHEAHKRFWTRLWTR
jgi:hypothetical protein